ncbi:MAG: high-affinity branched-chain amino acid ABC transporter permease LivM [Magnetococcales bacterium]|nr:high-affinity branched-chain amino acid ABC transporter permease LivM [Magnetococcales bacterium]NGZ05670.1 high-affinity branched-chain amino acid ABC transporter permease LivM [Magnetococcales bacterium]
MPRKLWDAVLAGVVALLLFVPLTGVSLSGYTLEGHWQRPLWLAVGVVLGRLLLGWFLERRQRMVGTTRRPGWITAWIDDHRPYIVIAAVIGALLVPWWIGKYWLNVAILALIYVLLGLGLNVVVGLAGLLDLGFVAFYAVGAYTYALGHHYFALSFWAAVPLGAMLAAGFGVVLAFPVLRMHGDYLAIVTLGFGEIIRLILNNWLEVTGGPNGLRVPFPSLFGMDFGRRASPGHVTLHEFLNIPYSNEYRDIFLYLLLFLVVCGMVFLVRRLRRMPLGRNWEALREDEIACRSLGIQPVTVKLSAFGLGAMTAGVGGVFFAASQGFVNPTSFTFLESAHILAIVVLGGMGSTGGVIVAAVVLTVLPEVLRDFAEYRGLLFGCAMVLMMMWRPRGLMGIRRARFHRSEVG